MGTEKPSEGAKTAPVVMQPQKKPGLPGFLRSRPVMIAGACLIVAVLAGVGMFLYRSPSSPFSPSSKSASGASSASKGSTSSGAPKSDKVSKATSAAVSQAHSGDYDKAQQSLDSAAGSNGATAMDKQGIYMTQASVAINAKKYDEAKNYALEAEKVMPTSSTAALLGDIAMDQSDKTAAAKYYQQALDRLNKQARNYPQLKSSYDAKLKAAQS